MDNMMPQGGQPGGQPDPQFLMQLMAMMQQKPGGLASILPQGQGQPGQPPQGQPPPQMPPGLPQGLPPNQPPPAPPQQGASQMAGQAGGAGQAMNMIPPQLLAQILQMLMSQRQGGNPQQGQPPMPENMQF